RPDPGRPRDRDGRRPLPRPGTRCPVPLAGRRGRRRLVGLSAGGCPDGLAGVVGGPWHRRHRLRLLGWGGRPPVRGLPGRPAAGPLAAPGLAWAAVRVFGSVVTVPIAEELAFRGFLSRRLIAADFWDVPEGRFTWSTWFVSSVLFGLLHGRWLGGTVAGLLY